MPDLKKVRVVGMPSMESDLNSFGLETDGCQNNAPFEKEPISIDSFNNYPMDKDIGAVLVGLDYNFTYAKLCLASLYI